jgi:hypothetical protein
MRFLVVPVVVMAPCAYVAHAEQPQTTSKWSFEDVSVGKLPNGWSSAKTGSGEGSVWKIVEDSTAPEGQKVLAQTAESPGSVFNLCVAENPVITDLQLSTSFKSVKGKVDQGGGLVWRYTDANNYYVARLNPLESNFRLFKVVNGVRTQLATKDQLVMPAGAWHTMTVRMKGEQIECRLDGEKYLEVKDSSFKKPGQIGLWTKADAQTYFDDVQVSELK